MKAIGKTLRISPIKANIVAGMVKGMPAKEASLLLSRVPKKAAKLIKKVLDSAIANAKNNFSQDEDALKIGHVIINKGPTLKRFRPISRGRAAPLLKRTSHIRVELVAQ